MNTIIKFSMYVFLLNVNSYEINKEIDYTKELIYLPAFE